MVVVKITGYSSKRSGFKSQQPQNSSQLYVTPLPRDLMPSSGFYRHQAHMCPNTHGGIIPTLRKTNKINGLHSTRKSPQKKRYK